MGDTPSASHGIVCNHSRNPSSSTRDGVGGRARVLPGVHASAVRGCCRNMARDLACLVFKKFGNFFGQLRYIRSIKHRFIIKLITGWTENHEVNPLNLINLSLEILYSITIFSNHDIIRLIRFFSRFESKIMK
jgi:hypothetical protein